MRCSRTGTARECGGSRPWTRGPRWVAGRVKFTSQYSQDPIPRVEPGNTPSGSVKRTELIGRFYIDDVSASLFSGMVWRSVPSPRFNGHIRQPIDGDTAPILSRPRRSKAAVAGAAELIEQGLHPPGLGPNHMRTHFAAVSVIGGDHLLLVQNRLVDEGVDIDGHSFGLAHCGLI